MKKLMLIFLSLAAAVSIAACSFPGGNDSSTISSEEEEIFETYDIPQITDEDKDFDIVLITDNTGIDSENNLSLWKSIIAYGDSNSKTYKYYSESGDSTPEDLIMEAAEHNAKIVILPDPSYKNTVLGLQDIYSNINFLIANTQPDEEFAENVHCISFREEQTGYLVGYLTIMDGYTSLGFIGGGTHDSNMRYLYGMVQGADDATQKLRIHDVTITYKFIEDREDKAKSMSKKLYDDGVDVIFTTTENISKGAAQSAKSAKKKIICSGSVYEGTNNVSLAYVEYDTVKAIDSAIKAGFDDELYWIGDEENKDINLGLDSECIQISTDEELWKFKNISKADYDDVVNKILNGEIVVSDNTEEKPPIAAVVYSEYGQLE